MKLKKVLLVASLFVLASSAVWGRLVPIGKVKIGQVRYHANAGQRDRALERAIVKAAEVPAGTELGYIYSRVQLKDGGPPHIIVLLSGSYLCGSGGCTAMIFDASYRLVTDMTLARADWLVVPHKTNGWHDIVCHISGGGGPTQYVTLQYNGKTYPDNPGNGTAVPAGTVLTGDAYLAENEKAPNYGYLMFTAGK